MAGRMSEKGSLVCTVLVLHLHDVFGGIERRGGDRSDILGSLGGDVLAICGGRDGLRDGHVDC